MPTIDCFLLTDAAQLVGGKLYVLGGGWARLSTQTLPLTRSFDLAVRVVVPWMETNRSLTFYLHLDDEDGSSLLDKPLKAEVKVGRPANLSEGSDQPVPLVLRLTNVTLPKSGRYVFRLDHEGEVIARTAFDLSLSERPARIPG